MKLYQILTGFFLIICSSISAQFITQDSLSRYYHKYPQEALKVSDSLYQQALHQHNNPLLLKALILKTTFTLEIDQNKYPEILPQLEEYLRQEKDLNTQSILHSYVGQLYSDYFHKNKYQIEERTSLKNIPPENIETWSKNLFKERIYYHIISSLTPKHILQNTPVSEFRAIFIQGDASDSLRPTLYDFLCDRAITILKQNRDFNVSLSYTNSPELFAIAGQFIKYSIPSEPLNASSNIIHIWQNLLTFHQSSDYPAAFIIANLERLDYIYKISTHLRKDSLYLNSLQHLKKQYISNPTVIEVMAKEATFLADLSEQNRSFAESKALKEQALWVCEEGIRLYPEYKRINLLHSIIQEIKAPALNASFRPLIYPEGNLIIKINSCNIKKATLLIYRIGLTTTAYNKLKKVKDAPIPQELICQYTIPLANELVRQDTNVEIKNLPPGLFKLIIKVPDAKEKISDEFICTRLFATHQQVGEHLRIRVCGWKSGKPVNQAKILISNTSQKNTLIDTIYTNTQGIAHLKLPANYFFYEVINSENPAGNSQRIYPEKIKSQNISKTAIFTDRKIYRPGQTVYFKGFVWQETPNQVHALDKKECDISFRDANQKEISKLKVITNRYGSFTGSFVIPTKTLNGNFSISANSGYTNLTVAEYKRPEFEITFSVPSQIHYKGDTIYLSGYIKSFSGMQMSHIPVRYDIAAFSYYHRLPLQEKTLQGIVYTDHNGKFEITFQASGNQNHSLPFYYELNTKATDPKGETQKNHLIIPVYSGTAQPVLQLPLQIDKTQKIAFGISLADVPLSPVARTVDYTLSKLLTPINLQQRLDTLIEKTILKGQLHIKSRDSIIPQLDTLPSGAYLFTVNCGELKAKQIFYLYSPTDKHPPIPTYNWLIDKYTACHPGDTARIQFGTSVKNAYVLYEIFNGNKLIQQKTVVLSNEILTINIPYLAQYGNQLWGTIQYVKDQKHIHHTVFIEPIRENKNLKIQTNIFRDKLQPGQQEKWDITILSDKDKPVIAEVLAMMYDASLDKLQPYCLNLEADYLFQPFASYWNSNFTYMSHYLEFPFRYFKQKKFPVPPFKFDKLNLYNNSATSSHETVYCEIITDCYSAEGIASDYVKSADMFSKPSPLKSSRPGENMVSGNMPPMKYRKKFQETAFFYPQLQSDSSGKVSIRFTIPESLTRWKFLALATTPEMATGQIQHYITTSKPLMVRPNLPRFLRSGDITELRFSISNLSDTIQQGISAVELFIPQTTQMLYSENQHFEVKAGKSETLRFRFTVPENIDLLGYRVKAGNKNFSDGEQNLIPVLPNELLLTKTLPFYDTSIGEQNYTLKDASPSGKNYRLTFEATANPMWYAILALPSLNEPTQNNAIAISASFYANTIAGMLARSNPHLLNFLQNGQTGKSDPNLMSRLEQNQELKSILLEASPWILQAQTETEQIQTLSLLFDQNRLHYLQTQALDKLSELQTNEGGWSWFKGMYADRFITMNILLDMARATRIGEYESGEKEKTMQLKALRYLDNALKKDFQKSPKKINRNQIIYLYVRSLYRDVPLGDALEAHKYFIRLARQQWTEFSFYEKAIAAIAMKNYGFVAEAANILKSLRQYAIVTHEMGMYWPNNKNTAYCNSATHVHTAIMEAFYEISGNLPELNLMQQWLLRQKQVQAWKSGPATVDAINALLLSGNHLLTSSEELRIKLGNHELTSSNTPLGYLKKTYSAEQIKPSMFTVRVSKQHNTPSWGSLYLQYFEKPEQIKDQKTGISIAKDLFLTAIDKNGRPTLIPLKDQPLKTGDQIMVRLTLSLNRDMEFLHLKDLRAACFEPTEQISGIQWKFGTAYYQEIKNAATNFFFNTLNRGTYIIEYPVWINQAGTFQDGIASLQSIYAPEYNASSKIPYKIEIK